MKQTQNKKPTAVRLTKSDLRKMVKEAILREQAAYRDSDAYEPMDGGGNEDIHSQAHSAAMAAQEAINRVLGRGNEIDVAYILKDIIIDELRNR